MNYPAASGGVSTQKQLLLMYAMILLPPALIAYVGCDRFLGSVLTDGVDYKREKAAASGGVFTQGNKPNDMNPYKDFTDRFKLLASKHHHLVVNTLSNIFTMRLIGNKTHGDLAEIGIAEFINQFMYDFKSTHVGKDLFRAKEHEEDIVVFNEITKTEFPISLKAYGDGPLQLSTDSDQKMFPFLEKQGKEISERKKIEEVFASPEFSDFGSINVMPLIYNESKKQCNIMIFDSEKAMRETAHILYIGMGESFSEKKSGKSRKHPI
jgi:hypothetical protein